MFGWDPLDATFDLVLFAAWLHHVPRERFEGFWKMVDRLVAPGGRVAFDVAVAGSRVHVAVPPAVPSDGYGVYHDPARHLSVRDLHGRRWKVVHEPWEPGDLVERLNRLGWDVDIRSEIGGTSRWAVASR